MDHGGMGHGGMDMPAMCNMNVHGLPLLWGKLCLILLLDAVYMGHNESLHHISLVAYPLYSDAPYLSCCRCYPHGWLRSCSRNKQEIRNQQYGICK